MERLVLLLRFLGGGVGEEVPVVTGEAALGLVTGPGARVGKRG